MKTDLEGRSFVQTIKTHEHVIFDDVLAYSQQFDELDGELTVGYEGSITEFLSKKGCCKEGSYFFIVTSPYIFSSNYHTLTLC